MVWQGIALALYCILMPFVALWLASRFAWAKFLGPVLMACTFGILVANQPFIEWSPEVAEALKKISTTIMNNTIPLAIPLMLFQSDLTTLREHGLRSALSFFISAFSVFVGTLGVMYWFGDALPNAAHTAGMVMSVYVGGVPNLVAVQTAIEASADTFALVQASTMFVSTFYLVFLLTIAKIVLQRFFPEHPAPEGFASDEEEDSVEPVAWSTTLKNYGLSFVASAACVAMMVGISFAIMGKIVPLIVVLGITTLAIGASFFKRLREIPTHEPLGTYLILAFCVAAGTNMNVAELVSTGPVVLTFTTYAVCVFLPIHYLLNRLMRIDLDTTITMSVATMFGPPFVPPVVQALGNRAVLLPGMTMGFLGYAVGTYMGIAVGLWL